MNEIILTVGMSCSGKTTWAEEFILNNEKYVNINRDDLRFKIFCDSKRDWTKYKFTNKNEKRVTEICDLLVFDAVIENKSIVLSDTNLNPSIRNKWKEWAETHNYKYSEKAFQISWEEARKRNTQREGGISESILWSQYLRMNGYLGRKVYEPSTSKPRAIIIDIDGTVASHTGIRKPYEWDKVHLDLPRTNIITMVQSLIEDGNIPIFLSGRDGCCKNATYDWIMEHIMQWHLPKDGGFHLFMREPNDNRNDKIVKEEIFWKYVADNFYITTAIDDRERILDLWRELGIQNIIDVSGDRHNVF